MIRVYLEEKFKIVHATHYIIYELFKIIHATHYIIYELSGSDGG